MAGYYVSVIVPTFNRASYIEECLDSLLSQTMPAYEILVVDDGSEDETATRVAAYANRVRYVHKENGGKPSAVNLGLTLVKGDLIWIFDDDDVALPDAIARRIEVLKCNPDAGLVYSPHFIGTNAADGRIVCGQLNRTPEYLAHAFLNAVLKNCFFHLGTALVRRECYHAVGGFDPMLLSGEDYDMQIRLARIVRPSYCPDPTFIFRQHQGARGAKTIRYAATKRNMVFRKYSRMLGQKVRSELPLGEYLVPCQVAPLSQEAHREALLQRMCAMGNHGCISELFEDLQELLSSLTDEKPIGKRELRVIAEAICTGYAYEACEQNWTAFMEMARTLKNYPSGNIAIGAMASGILLLAKGHPGTVGQRIEKTLKAAELVLEIIRWKFMP